MQFRRRVGFSFKIKLTNQMGIFRRDVRQNGDNAFAAERKYRNNLIVIPGIKNQIIAASLAKFQNRGKIAGRFFNSDNARVL